MRRGQLILFLLIAAQLLWALQYLHEPPAAPVQRNIENYMPPQFDGDRVAMAPWQRGTYTSVNFEF